MGTSLWLCRKIQDFTRCASRDIWVSFRPLSFIFTMAIKLTREQFPTMILYDWKISLNYRESHVHLVAAWDDQASSDRKVLNWFHEYERGKLDVSDSPRSERPRTALTDEMIDADRLMIDDDPHVTYQQIEFSLGINSPAIYSILHDHLKLRKVCARWIPHSLTNDQKRLRIEFCRQSLKRFEQGRSRCVFDIVTGDQSWFHHYNPETKQQWKTWVSKDDPRPTIVRRNKSFGKRTVEIFFMKSGLIVSIALESGASISARSYVTNWLSRIFDAVAHRREKTWLRGLILHDDNARLHQAWMTTEYVAENRVDSYQNPPYSPDLSLCHFFLFQKLKNQLRGIQFNNDEEMLEALNLVIGCLTKEDFQNCFNDWFSWVQKYIDVGGECFEKINWHWYLNIFCKGWRKNFPSAPFITRFILYNIFRLILANFFCICHL